MTATKLTKQQIQELREELRGGADLGEMAKKYSISTVAVGWHRRVADGRISASNGKPMPIAKKGSQPKENGRVAHSTLESLDADILAGMSESELIRKYHIGRGAIYAKKRELRGTQAEAIVVTPEQIPRLVELCGRIAAKRPELFAEMIAAVVRKHPNLLIEVL